VLSLPQQLAALAGLGQLAIARVEDLLLAASRPA